MNTRHFYYLKKDFLGEFFFISNKIYNLVYSTLTSLYVRLLLGLKGVKYGNGFRSTGVLKVERFQCSYIEIGNNCTFNSSSRFNFRGLNHPCIIQTGKDNARIIIGNNCGFSGVSIVADKEVVIDDNVKIGANTIIGDRDDHEEIYASSPSSVYIEKNVWIGMNVIILKGVTIGENSIIGAGSVVTKDIPANVIAAGVPCKIIKNRN